MFTLSVITMKIGRFPWSPACAGVSIKKPAVILIPSSILRKGMVIPSECEESRVLAGNNAVREAIEIPHSAALRSEGQEIQHNETGKPKSADYA